MHGEMNEGRCATAARAPRETDITVTIDLDGSGQADVQTGVGFFDHMLDAFCRHALFDLTVRCQGDLHVDAHHSVEDTGIVIGQAVAQALGDKRGIERFASCAVPMDEALVMCAMDISGRGQAFWALDIPIEAISTFDTQLARSSSSPWRRMRGSPCICASSQGRTLTISSKPRSKPAGVLCARLCPSIRAPRAWCLLPRVPFDSRRRL